MSGELRARLLEQADRRESVIAMLAECLPDIRDLARQDVADIWEAVRLLSGAVLH